MIQAKTMLPQAACACKCAGNSACECVLELVAGRVCVYVWPGKMTVSVSLIVDRFDPPGLWVPSYSPRSSVSFRTLVHSRVLLSCVAACAETAKGLLRSASTNRIDSGCPAHDSDTQIKQFCLSIRDQPQCNPSCTGCSLAV
jgi:hypothetical protein